MSQKGFFLISSLILYVMVLPWSAHANANKCMELFSNLDKQEELQKSLKTRTYKTSDLSPRPQLWLRIRQALQKNVSGLEHPLEATGQSPDRIGIAYQRMYNELPLLKLLHNLVREIDQGRVLDYLEYIRLKRNTANQLIAISKKPNSDLEVFAAIEAVKIISNIETRVEFPRPKEDIQRENEKKTEKKKEEKKESEQDEKEQEPEWNKTQNKYNPENKDLANDGKGKKKNVDIVLTDVDVFKRLLRQKIYDLFNLKDWSSVPAEREQIQFERKFTKKIIINPLNETFIDVPVPYGFTLIPGKYADHQVIEVGPGEFKVQVYSKNPVTVGLARIQKEAYLGAIPKQTSQRELEFWPQHLLLFTQSLKGLSPLEAAARLEKYISEEGGFLYYSKGDKITEGDLTKIDQKFSQLLTQMPKPMAMANVGAFNCDGAAWIGALLLRDVLNIPVRIAGGRTSAGTKTISGENFHVVKSADPAHAWVEVFDGNIWIPFDMTPKHNTPESRSLPTDVEREESKPQPKSDQKPTESSQNSAEETSNEPKINEQPIINSKGKELSKKEDKEKQDDESTSSVNERIDDLLKVNSTQRQKNEQYMDLVARVIKRTELVFLERLIQEGYQTSSILETTSLFEALSENSSWKNAVERSKSKIATILHDSKFAKFNGLQNFLSDIRVDFSQNNARVAKQKLVLIQRLFVTLSEYRGLTKQEVEALRSIEEIVRSLDQIKHENSKEYDAVQDLIQSLPGTVSKAWLSKQYGKDYDQLGSSANIKLAQDIVSGMLKPLLQMGAVSEFVDMTLNSTPEPQWKDEPTLNRSLNPKPRQDLIITRNPLDFAKMLWSLRPGEHMFAPTLQGRQFAIGSLETRRIINPKSPLEKKVSVIYYDVSPSMNGHPIESQDALLMAFVDKALSEVDAIGRPTHEIYLIPFNDNILQGVHISSREDALAFLSRRMNYRTKTSGSTDIQKVLENFYDTIATSYRNKSAQGAREKLFQKANMVLFSDGGSIINLEQLQAKRKTIPKEIQINMNFVNIGDQVNETLRTLSQSDKLSSNKPTFRKMSAQMMEAIANISTQYSPDAFATSQRISSAMLTNITALLQKISIDTRQKIDSAKIDLAISQIQTTKADASQLPGIRQALSLTQLAAAINSLKLDPQAKLRIVESVIESYQQLTGRSWKDMTYPEKEALEKLRTWARS